MGLVVDLKCEIPGLMMDFPITGGTPLLTAGNGPPTYGDNVALPGPCGHREREVHHQPTEREVHRSMIVVILRVYEVTEQSDYHTISFAVIPF